MDNKQALQNVFNQNSTIDNQYNIAYINYEDNAEIGNINNHIDFHVPKKNESFFGRDRELQILEEWLTSGEQKMIAVCGCAGYGKTELVKQFVRRSRDGDTVAHVMWMDAETLDKLLQSFRDLARILRLPQVDDASLIQSVFSRIESFTGRSLIVLDNAESRQSIRKFEPEGKTLCVVTSRMQDWGHSVPTLPLAPLSATSALALLRAELPNTKDEDSALSVLAAALSCVPLALHVAAGYVRQEMRALGNDFSLPDYVRQIQESCDSLIDTPMPSSSANTYDKSLSQAIQISLNKIQNSTHPNSELAWRILHVSAYLYSDKISIDDVLCILCLNIDSKSNILRACNLLQDYSLITFDEFVKIHRFIQNTLVAFQNQNNLETFYKTCLKLIFATNQTSSFHKHFILNHVGKNLDIFKEFYYENKEFILNNNRFFVNLISTRCIIGLKEILNDLGGLASDVINKLGLLHVAVNHGQHDILELFLMRGVYVERKDNANNTALSLAAFKIDLRSVHILTAHNADTNATDGFGWSVLHRLILASGFMQNTARSEEVCKLLRLLVKLGARTDAVTLLGVTLIHMAAGAHCVHLVRCLVCEFGLDVHVVDKYSRTPLHWVSFGMYGVRDRRLRTAECLLEFGARRDVVDRWGRTPAQHARSECLEYLAYYLENPSPEYLIQQDSLGDILRAAASAGDVSSLTSKLDELGDRAVQTINEFCLLHVAARQRRHDVLELLLVRGAHVDHRDDTNSTALHHAVLEHVAKWGDMCAVLRSLVERGAHTDAVALNGESLLHMAARAHSADLVRCLVHEFGLDVNAMDEGSLTPLFYVCEGVDVDRDRMKRTAACLLELGARSDVMSSQGRTFAQHAQMRGYRWLAIWMDHRQCWWRRLWNFCSRFVCSCGRKLNQD